MNLPIAATHSETVAASKQVWDGPAIVLGLHIIFGASTGNVKIRDGGAAGTILLDIDTAGAAGQSIPVVNPAIECRTDVYVEVTNCEAWISVFARN